MGEVERGRQWPAAAAVAAVCATTVVVGWSQGYRDPAAYVAFAGLAALLAVAAWNIASRAFAPSSLLDGTIRASVIAFALIVACGLALGAVGRLTLGAWLGLETVIAAASFLLPRRQSEPDVVEQAGAPLLVFALVGALLVFATAYAVTHSPMTLYDSVSYHLFFSARWLQDRALSIIPTPFSDEAQAYAPANGELFFLWLMLPFHGDLLARIGQLPFALLAAATLYALAVRLGAHPRHAAYPAAFFLLSRPIVEQAIGADVDLICAAMFLTSLYLGVIALERDERRDWMVWGISLGLYWGSKHVALVYTPVFLLLALARGPRMRAAWALPGIAAFALPWYLRNWMVAGSPIYPASLSVAGVTLASGAFDRAAMLNTVFHTNDMRLFLPLLAHAFGPTLILVWAPFAVVGAVAMSRRGWWPYRFLVAVPLLMAPLYWFGFPVNIDSRFLMPAVAPALLPMAFVFRDRIWNGVVHVLYVAGMVWIIVGVHAEIPAQLPWFMNGWLTLDGLVTRPFLLWFASFALILAAVWWGVTRRARWAVPLAASFCAGSVCVLATGTARLCPQERCDYLETTSPFIRRDLARGWQWTADNIHGATVAYTGINLPYPLTGERLSNRVVYVNIDGRTRWRLHDYDRAYRTGRFVPLPPLLATSSGELLPAVDGPRHAVRPRYARLEGFKDAWVFSLDKVQATHLFVSALSAYERDYVWHNERDFPIEDEWARSDPATFQLVFENSQVRIYAITRRQVVHPA